MSGISAQGSTLNIGGSGGAAKTITGMSPGNPTIFTSAAHGLSNGDVGAVAAVVGTASTINGTSRVVSNKTPNTFAVLDFDSTGLAYTSGGTFTPAPWTKIMGFQSFNGFAGTAADLDVTDLDSIAMENIAGLKDEGNFSFGMKILGNDPGQMALRAARSAGTVVPMKLTLPNGQIAAFSATVKSIPAEGGVNAVLKGTVETKISGSVVWS